MKRLLIIMTLLFSLVTVASAAENDLTNKVSLLNALDIIEFTEQDLDKRTITEKEFLTSLIGLTSEYMPKGDMVEFARINGIITSSNDVGNEKIKNEKAIEWLVKALGYDFLLEQKSAVSVASDIGLTYNSKLQSNLMGDDAVKMLYSALNVVIPEVKFSNKFEITTTNERTALTFYKKVGYQTGQITATRYTSMIGEEGVQENQIEIDNVIYETDISYAPEILGSVVKYYIHEEDGDIKVIYIENSKRTKQIELTHREIIDVSSNFQTMQYESGTRIKSAKLNPALRVVYNGRLYSGYTKTDLMPQSGRVVLSDIDSDGKYDILFVYSYQIILAEQINKESKKIFNKFSYAGALASIALDDNTVSGYQIRKNNVKIDIADIAPGDVLSVGVSNGSEPYVFIEVSSEKRLVKALNISNSKEEAKLMDIETEEQKTYYFSDTYIESLALKDRAAKELTMRDDQTVYIDAFGEIVLVDYDIGKIYEYAYALKLYEDFDNETTFIKILNDDGRWEKLPCAKKVRLDGTRVHGREVKDKLGGEYFVPNLLKLRIKDGKISEILTATQSDNFEPDKFISSAEVTNVYSPHNQSFYCKHYFDRYTKIFIIPTEHTYDEEDYKIGTTSFFLTGGSFTYRVYDVDDFNVAGAAVVKNTKTVGISAIPFYVTGTEVSINKDDEPATYLIGNYKNAFEFKLPVAPEYTLPSYKRGDIVFLRIEDGEITDSELKYNYANGRELFNPTTTNVDALRGSPNPVRGIVKAVNRDASMIKIECGGELVLKVDTGAKITKYKNGEKYFESAIFDDININDYVVVFVRDYKTPYIAIYKQE